MSGVPGASALASHSQSESASDTGNDGADAACQRSDAPLRCKHGGGARQNRGRLLGL